MLDKTVFGSTFYRKKIIKAGQAMQIIFLMVLNLSKFHIWKVIFMYITQEKLALQCIEICGLSHKSTDSKLRGL